MACITPACDEGHSVARWRGLRVEYSELQEITSVSREVAQEVKALVSHPIRAVYFSMEIALKADISTYAGLGYPRGRHAEARRRCGPSSGGYHTSASKELLRPTSRRAWKSVGTPLLLESFFASCNVLYGPPRLRSLLGTTW